MKKTGSIGVLITSCLLLGGVATPSRLLAQNVQVTSANPPAAPQGTLNLDVAVGGSGFKNGAKAAFFLSGTTDPDGITVNSTSFNGSSQVTANITISDTTSIADFDIQVTNSDGRTGKGSHLFAVTAKGTSITCASTNVTSVVNNADSNNVPLQYQSDGLGPYTTFSTRGNKDSVNSLIQGSCSWALDTTNSAARGIVVTLAYPDSNGATAPFVGPQEIKGVFHTICSNNTANNGVNIGSMTFVGETLACPMQLHFAFNGVTYNLGMSPLNWPGASWMQVTCNGATGGQCNAWTIQPDPATAVINPATNQLSGVAELFLPSCNGCTTGTPLGQYLVSFSILIHK